MESKTFFIWILFVLTVAPDVCAYGLQNSPHKERSLSTEKAQSPGRVITGSLDRKKSELRGSRAIQVGSNRRLQQAREVSLQNISRKILINADATKKESAVWENKFAQKLPLILKEDQQQSSGDFYIGSIYSPDSGKTYSAYLKR